MLSQFSLTKFNVPDLTNLVERFYCIPTGRTLFYKTLTFKIDEIDFYDI